MKNKSTLEQLNLNAQLLIDEVKRLEPADTDVMASHSSELTVTYEANDFSMSASKSTAMYGVRTIVGGRMGFMTTNSSTEEALREVAREVQMVARLSPSSPYQSIAAGPALKSHAELWDESLENLPPKELFRYAEKVVADARADARVTIDRIELSVHLSTFAFMNSNGYHQTARQTSVNWFAMGMAKTPQEVTSFDYDGGSVAKLSELEGRIGKTMGQFCDSVVSSLGARKGETYKGKVLLHPDAVANLIAGVVTANSTAIAHQDGFSPWRGKLGQQVISRAINLSENPLDQSRADGWSTFDREGVACAKHDLIKEGQLSFIAHNCFSAKRGETQPTGNASGGSRQLPGIGFLNLELSASQHAQTMSDEALMKELGTGLVVKRFSGNMDPYSGQFSGVAKNSWWVSNGQRAYPVQEVMISGSLFDLANAVVAVGEKSHLTYGDGLMPFVIVDGVSVTAG